MSLSVGIVGLPNAGKSTLFNALASRRLAETAPRPFTTIDPHEAVVPVPDRNLYELAAILSGEDIKILGEKSLSILVSQYPSILEIVPASVTFIDIAGLVKGAHKGEGLGNQFLAKIREVDAIVHVVRVFSDPEISHQHPTHEPGTIKQALEDIEIVNLELELGGIKGKPVIYVLNVEESDVKNFELIAAVEQKYTEKAIAISAKMEEELIDFSEEEKRKYLKSIGLQRSGLERLIVHAYELLELLTFYTIKPSSAKASERRGGGTIVTAWSIKRGAKAIEAAEHVHTDFAKHFIKAEVINVDELLKIGGLVSSKHSTDAWKKAKDSGKIRLEGKDYLVQNKDVIEFKVNV